MEDSMTNIDSGTVFDASNDGVKHVVLLMLENHSFDQMLGSLQELFEDVDGVTPELARTRTNLTISGVPIAQQETKEQQMSFDPKHEHVNVLAQLEGDNGGFVKEFEKAYSKSKIDDLKDVMGYYPLDFLPALHALGRDFTICDNWFASLPGPTWPNRFFALTGTCAGEVCMPAGAAMLNPKWYTEQSQATIFDRLNEQKISWSIYYYDFPCSLVLKNQRRRENLSGYKKIKEFFTQAAGDEALFPEFTFIEPQYFGVAQNDDHPPHNVMKAEKLIADVYNALRSNKALWESSLLVVIYDEHGGFYDHVKPPKTVAPDDLTSAYGFDQLGVRVPALLISPRCQRRVEKTQFDHTSLLKYLTEKWNLGSLGNRTAAANSIGCAVDINKSVREDTIPFIRVSNADLISNDIEAEKDATNANQDALHHFAEFLLAEGDAGAGNSVVIAADAAKVGNWWISAKHWLGRMVTSTGGWLSNDMRVAKAAREERTSQAFEQVKASAADK
jgi:phospholipase C